MDNQSKELLSLIAFAIIFIDLSLAYSAVEVIRHFYAGNDPEHTMKHFIAAGLFFIGALSTRETHVLFYKNFKFVVRQLTS